MRFLESESNVSFGSEHRDTSVVQQSMLPWQFAPENAGPPSSRSRPISLPISLPPSLPPSPLRNRPTLRRLVFRLRPILHRFVSDLFPNSSPNRLRFVFPIRLRFVSVSFFRFVSGLFPICRRFGRFDHPGGVVLPIVPPVDRAESDGDPVPSIGFPVR